MIRTAPTGSEFSIFKVGRERRTDMCTSFVDIVYTESTDTLKVLTTDENCEVTSKDLKVGFREAVKNFKEISSPNANDPKGYGGGLIKTKSTFLMADFKQGKMSLCLTFGVGLCDSITEVDFAFADW